MCFRNVLTVNVENTITGEHSLAFYKSYNASTNCDRYSEQETSCGKEGKFFATRPWYIPITTYNNKPVFSHITT